jgi:hypothetical protein
MIVLPRKVLISSKYERHLFFTDRHNNSMYSASNFYEKDRQPDIKFDRQMSENFKETEQAGGAVLNIFYHHKVLHFSVHMKKIQIMISQSMLFP